MLRRAAAPCRGCGAGGRAAPAGGGPTWRGARLLVPVLAGLLPMLSPAAAAPVEPVVVRAAVHPGFGRLVFEWPRAITVDGRHDGDRLVLRFARPHAVDLAAAGDRLRAYVSEIAAGADDHEVILRLTPGVAPAIATYEERIVAVDFRRSAPAAPPVEVRTGSHQGFVRIVLDWARPVAFEATASGRSWRIAFDQEAEIDVAAIGERFRHLLDAASSARGDGRSELRLALKPGVVAKVFEVEGARVVVDLYPPVGAADEAAAADRSAAATPTHGSPRAAPPEPAAGASSAPAATTSARSGGNTTIATALALRIAPAEDQRGAALDFAWSRPLPAAFLIRAGYLWGVFVTPAAAPLDLPAVFPSPLPDHLGPGELIEAAGGKALRFALRRPLAATVERDEARWRVVFGAAPAAPEAVRIERAEGPPRLRIVAGEAVRLVRLTDPEVGDELVLWPLLAAGRGQPTGRRLVELELLPTAQGLAWRARSDGLRVEVTDDALELVARDGLRLSARRAVEPADPAVSDPVRPPAPPAARPTVAEAVAPEAAGRELTTAPAASTAAAGAAAPSPGSTAAPAARAAPAPPARDGVAPDPAPRQDRSGRGDPASSDPRERAEVEPQPSLGLAGPADAFGPDAGVGALDLARFSSMMALDRSALEQRIAQASPAERPLARLDLARWFLAHGLAPEAQAVLAAAGEPEVGPAATAAHQRVRQCLAAAAALLLDPLDDAARVLEARALDGDAEIALWRAARAAAREDWPRGARELERAQGMFARYPPALQLRLGLPAAEAAIEAGAHDLAQQVLSALAKLELSPGERARLAFHEGLAQARRGAIERAAALWLDLQDGPDHDSRVRAAYARVRLLLDAGRLGPTEAIASLAPARAQWHGHPWQARMLGTLADLYRQGGDRAAAIRTWHALLAAFPAMPDAARIERAMRDAFAEAMWQDDASGAVRAYALFRDFPQLVAEGAAGDALRRGLAARLADLDLLEPAAALLDELVERRLSGTARAEAGADLAALWLRVPDPAAALAALERSQVEDHLPAALERRRRLLQTRALAATGRPPQALALLDGRGDAAEQQLRAEILWQTRDWVRLAASLEGLLARREDASALSAEEQDLVIRLAVAYGEQADHAALARLRARFGAALSGQAGEPAFLMATMTPGRPVAAEAVLAVAAEHLGRARDYLAAAP